MSQMGPLPLSLFASPQTVGSARKPGPVAITESAAGMLGVRSRVPTPPRGPRALAVATQLLGCLHTGSGDAGFLHQTFQTWLQEKTHHTSPLPTGCATCWTQPPILAGVTRSRKQTCPGRMCNHCS